MAITALAVSPRRPASRRGIPTPAAWSADLWWRGRRPFHALGNFGGLLNAIGTLWIMALMALICADVVARSFYDRPLPRVPEFVGYSIVAIVFLQMANTLRRRKLTRADAFIDHLMEHRPAAAGIYNALFHLLGALVFGLIAGGLGPDALRGLCRGRRVFRPAGRVHRAGLAVPGDHGVLRRRHGMAEFLVQCCRPYPQGHRRRAGLSGRQGAACPRAGARSSGLGLLIFVVRRRACSARTWTRLPSAAS